jgi:hypothetical protein
MFNALFLAYLASPRTCHAMVGYLEEEAVRTYTHALEVRRLEGGRSREVVVLGLEGLGRHVLLGWLCSLCTQPRLFYTTQELRSTPPPARVHSQYQ